MTTAKQARNSLFKRGSAVFVCADCGWRTRDVGHGHDSLCAYCYDIAGWENTISDCGEGSDEAKHAEEQIKRLEGMIKARAATQDTQTRVEELAEKIRKARNVPAVLAPVVATIKPATTEQVAKRLAAPITNVNTRTDGGFATLADALAQAKPTSAIFQTQAGRYTFGSKRAGSKNPALKYLGRAAALSKKN